LAGANCWRSRTFQASKERAFSMVDKQKYIQRVKNIYEKKTGNTLSDVEALNIFENLVTLVDAVYKPIPKEFFQEIDKNYQLSKKPNERKLS
jgi:hypothetical protein